MLPVKHLLVLFALKIRRWFALMTCAAAAMYASVGALTFQMPLEVSKIRPAMEKNGDIQTQLNSLLSPNGQHPKDCGTKNINDPDLEAIRCVENAFISGEAFRLLYNGPHYALFQSGYGLVGNGKGNVFQVEYDSRGLLNFGLRRNVKVSHKNQIRVTPCIKPIRFTNTEVGIVSCVLPVNEELSEQATQQKPIETTVCAILEHPATFNNKLVRIRGYALGNFEYSELGADGCSDSLWFEYGSGDGPPGLVATVSGGARAGAEDSEGRYIRPIPVKLVEDSNFQRFQRLMRARVKADDKTMKSNSDTLTFYRVAATFTGRIDGVSDDVHAFHLTRKESGRADFLGFGQMGLFDAQFVMQSVERDAVLEPFPPIPNFLLRKPK